MGEISRRINGGVTAIAILVGVVGSLIAVSVYGGTSVFADQSSVSDSANVMKISPVRSDIEIAPGESKIVKVYVSNTSDQEVALTPVENDFISSDENGTPALILDASKYAPTHSLKRFMEPVKAFTIAAHKTATVDVKISVPLSAQAGGYFGAIRFAPSDAVSGGQVNLSPSAASLILMTVPGNVVEKLELTNFDIKQGAKSVTNFTTSDKLSILVRFQNKGNVQEGPFGKITVKKGSDVLSSIDFNSNTPRDMILPDSARRWTLPLDKIDGFGHYTLEATFSYGKDNQSINVSKSFWVIPTAVILMATGALVVLIGLIALIWYLIVRSHRRRIRGFGYGRRR